MKKPKRKTKESILIIVIFVAAAIILAYSLTTLSKTKVSKAVATVNGQDITEEDLEEVMITVPPQLRENLTREILIEQAINIEIIRQEAEKLEITVSDAEVEKMISNTLALSGVKKEDFFSAIKKQQGVSEQALKNAYKNQLLALKFVNQTIMGTIIITEDELKETYDLYSEQLNMTYEEVREDLEKALKVQKGQLALETFLRQKRQEYNITRTGQ